jgi:DNA-binding NarL/FixJ family response regulator
VFVVDDHPPTLGQVARLLERDFRVTGLLLDSQSLIEAYASAPPDVVVLDVLLPGSSGFEAATSLRAAGCTAPIVFFSVDETPEMVRAAWAAGGIAYVAKRDLHADLIPAMEAALAGTRFVSSVIDLEGTDLS